MKRYILLFFIFETTAFASRSQIPDKGVAPISLEPLTYRSIESPTLVRDRIHYYWLSHGYYYGKKSPLPTPEYAALFVGLWAQFDYRASDKETENNANRTLLPLTHRTYQDRPDLNKSYSPPKQYRIPFHYSAYQNIRYSF